MTTGIFVTYDTTTLSPTPIVNYTHQPVSFGYLYGYNTDISLEGLYTGITTTGAAISYLTGVFANQFKNLTVTDDSSNTLYQWSGVTVESINLDVNNYYPGSFVKYSIKLRSFDIPSGVIEPSNEYAFVQNDDGTVTVNHKISARGVRNSNAAFQNAINFVQQFTGKDPYSNCAPFLVPNGSGVLLSIQENINRADSVYTVGEVYSYNTGVLSGFVSRTSLDMSDNMTEEFRQINYNVKIQGSPIKNNISSIIANNLSYGLLSNISGEFGYDTTNWVKNTYSANVDSGAATIEIKVSYVSGANPSGFFDYSVVCDKDLVKNTETWKLDGEFRCFGPLDYKLNQINAFKQAYGASNWRPYLTGLIISSPAFSGNHDSSINFSPNCDVVVNENPKLATLKITLDMEAGYEPIGLDTLKYSIESQPARWIYELLPSATIEGSFVIQDLQAQTRPKQKFSFEGDTFYRASGLNILSGYLNTISSAYVNSGTPSSISAFLVDEEISTGAFSVSYSKTWLGQDKDVGTGLLSLQAIGTSNFFVPPRPSGYNFGY